MSGINAGIFTHLRVDVTCLTKCGIGAGDSERATRSVGVCVHAYTRTHTRTHMYAQLHAYAHPRPCPYTLACPHPHTLAHAYVCATTRICTPTHMPIHTCMSSHLHTHPPSTTFRSVTVNPSDGCRAADWIWIGAGVVFCSCASRNTSSCIAARQRQG